VGEAADVKKYSDLAVQMRAAFTQRFVNSSATNPTTATKTSASGDMSVVVGEGYQTDMSMALYLGLVSRVVSMVLYLGLVSKCSVFVWKGSAVGP
jgi:hypothetical protein